MIVVPFDSMPQSQLDIALAHLATTHEGRRSFYLFVAAGVPVAGDATVLAAAVAVAVAAVAMAVVVVVVVVVVQS